MQNHESHEAMGPHQATATEGGEGGPSSTPRDPFSDPATSATGRPRRPSNHASNGRLGAAGERAAGAIDATADFVRDFDGKALASQAGALAGKHPGKAVALAIIAGFLLGRVMARPSA